jgi:hypothetical protein
VISEFETKTYFGQLLNIFVVHLPANKELGLKEDKTLILALIDQCKAEQDHDYGNLDLYSYKDMGPEEVVDMTCVQCLIGRVSSGGKWVIIDRSGELQRAYYIPGE